MTSSDTETSKIFRYRMAFPADDAGVRQARQAGRAAAVTQHSHTRLLLQPSQKHAARIGIDEIIVAIYLEGHREITAGGARRAVAPGEIVHDLWRAITFNAALAAAEFDRAIRPRAERGT